MKKILAFLMGAVEFRHDCTKHYADPMSMLIYDYGRDFAHRATLRLFDS
ncbi:hypothetical protein LCGC14_0420610 [marine sediment metagenome]|uniref:Uncharacterized protein n=1 Tax=marine sediment metagenome TaxID=412755 RepID=A0A0F9T929_9ZZZZ